MKNCKTGILLETTALILLWTFTIPSIVAGQNGPRARDLGIPFDGITGPNNAITDVDDVLVGH
ncbi:uncharacterized protein METZ01_LOCUS222167, partial [marine metagenome]